ncbi:hypothetical protein EAG18_15370 [Pseudoalteromonas sp. J010]|uniref:Uncharacterized protein n=1 Tax=Pseudoalteromonas peptidolytica F12-50-A1 TaxID=1315280 RepID=A0A8I0T2C4_9GAMM|nr:MULTISPECIES: hypothetical protein [Pseudoalteromonas]MBE0345301.1 hypothetical protein [Pseudoalteromonas peptidolytica F12-50-A1]NLR17084.1 hypothetical protein [Pseudoalteromonas peptidolytica]RRS07666.1 hypothetical protein EAG18_15370 [Pseudoalteromonas sp. J010]GEK10223.1 hypothetical protein PPE03_24720 [Pseudoalteromonas peptidolytica]
MNPIYADILDIVPLKLNSAFAHLDAKQSELNTSIGVEQLKISARLLQDIETAVGATVEVVVGEDIQFTEGCLSLPSTQLSSAQKRVLWQLIWNQQNAN